MFNRTKNKKAKKQNKKLKKQTLCLFELALKNEFLLYKANMKLEYIWLGGDSEFRSKVRTVDIDGVDSYSSDSFSPDILDKLEWNYDGSSTNQADGHDSEIIIKPVKIYCNNDNYFALCNTFRPDGTPLDNNHRVEASKIFEEFKEDKPWFGLEQEYFILDPNSKNRVLNSKKGKNLAGKNYCGIGSFQRIGRTIADQHYDTCISAGIQISGYNAEVAEGQWEFQIGPAEGISAGDDLLMARYLLIKIAESHGYDITFEPKPINKANGSGCHTNFSTVHTRTVKDAYLDEIKNIEKNYQNLASIINTDSNKQRLTGTNETAAYDSFSYGVGNRTTTIRIPRTTERNGLGYFELRTPPSDCDPYQITSALTKSCLANQILILEDLSQTLKN